MANRSTARRSSSRGRAVTGARPAATSSRTRRRRPRRAASDSAPSKSAPRRGDLAEVEAAATVPAEAGRETLTTDRRSFSGRSRPGTYSSSTAWKFVPPKPKALSPARRTPPAFTSHSRHSVFTKKGECSKSMFGFGAAKFRLGGNTFS